MCVELVEMEIETIRSAHVEKKMNAATRKSRLGNSGINLGENKNENENETNATALTHTYKQHANLISQPSKICVCR